MARTRTKKFNLRFAQQEEVAKRIDLCFKGKNASIIAKELNIPAPSISDWRRGRCTPTKKSLEILANYFNKDYNWLNASD